MLTFLAFLWAIYVETWHASRKKKIYDSPIVEEQHVTNTNIFSPSLTFRKDVTNESFKKSNKQRDMTFLHELFYIPNSMSM